MNEVARNGDGFKKSVYFHKDKNSNGSKLKAGPVWDFDWAWKNIYECDIVSQIDGSGWAHHVNDCPTDNNSCGWYIRLLQDDTFRNELHCAYESYRTTMLDTAFMFQYIDSIVGRVENAQVRHFGTWPILGVSGPAPDIGPVPTTYADEITAFKEWITLRLDWLDANMPGLCQTAGLGDDAEIDPLSIFPNPSNGRVIIQGTLGGTAAGQLHMYDVTGRTVNIPIAAGRFPCIMICLVQEPIISSCIRTAHWYRPVSWSFFNEHVTVEVGSFFDRIRVPSPDELGHLIDVPDR